jgi:uncharacterized RDD family membrane protein YckC
MFCFKCGSDISAQDTVCPVCGAAVNRTEEGGPLPPQHKAVSFGDRAAAMGIDLLILLGVWFLLFQLVYTVSFYLLPVLFVFYFTWTVGGARQATLGQRCLKLKVVNTRTGGSVGYVRALVRALVTAVSIGVVGLGCALYFITDGRMLHDLISGTCVVLPEEK